MVLPHRLGMVAARRERDKNKPPRQIRPAKVTRPSAAGLVRRERLLQILDRARDGKCIWVAGPGGAGKTSLVGTWIDSSFEHSVWYQVDAGDQDPATLFHYLTVAAGADGATPSELPSLTPEIFPTFEIFARRFFEAFFAAFPTPFVLAFDNYQDVADTALFHVAFSAALSALPRGALLVCLSRAGPPPALARWCADVGFRQLGWDELRLTDEEAQALGRSSGIADDELCAMNSAARGWAAGLRLMLGGRTTGLPFDWRGSEASQTLFEYFANEVFQGMPSTTRAILLDTALFANISPGSAQEFTGSRAAAEILANLHKNRLFTDRRIAPDGSLSYEYHPLFRAFLVQRVQRERSPEELLELRRRAAQVLERAGDPGAAAELWLEAADFGALARLIAAHAQSFCHQARWTTLEGWILAVPEPLREQNAWLLYWLGVCRNLRDPALGRISAEQAYRRFREQGDIVGSFAALASLLGSYFLEWGSNAGLDPWIAEFEELITLNGGVIPASTEVEVLAACKAWLLRDAAHPALPALAQRAEQLARSSSDPLERVTVSGFAIQFFTWVGDHARARALCDDVVANAELGAAQLSFTIGHGVLAWSEGDHATAHAAWDEVFRLSQRAGIAIYDASTHLYRALTALGEGNVDAAQRSLDCGWPLLRGTRVTERQMHQFARASVLVLRGQASEALSGLREAIRTVPVGGGSSFIGAAHETILGQVLSLNGAHAEARERCQRAAEFAARMSSDNLKFSAELALAYSFIAAGEDAPGLVHLERAMAVGRRRGYTISVALWVPAIASQLCARALQAGIETEYVQRLIRVRGLKAPSGEIEDWPWPVKIYALGRFAIMLDGEPLTFQRKTQKKPLELLKVVIAHGGRGVDQGVVTECLWQDLDGDAARNACDLALHRLRKLLKSEDALVVQDGKLSLAASSVWVDTWAFERLSDALTKGSADRAKVRDETERLLRTYTGHFLGSEEISWGLALRERLRSKFVRCIAALGRAFELEGDWGEATTLYRRATEVEPLADDLCCLLMLSYRAEKRHVEAVVAYRRYRELLSTTLGIRPSAKTDAIYQSLKQR